LTQKANLFGGKQLMLEQNENPSRGNLFRRIIAAVNQLAANTGVSAVGESSPPPTVGGVNVKAAGEMVHVTISDANQVSKPIEYFVEHSTSPNFVNPHVTHLVSSRGLFITLPSKNDAGTAQPWYFRAYSQYPGSQPSAPVYYGGLSPTAVTLSGTTHLTPLASTGSGTASPIGQQGGWGRGKTSYRPSGSTTGRP
jgi:hypothetical protein